MRIKFKSTNEKLNELLGKIKKRKKGRLGGIWFRHKKDQQNKNDTNITNSGGRPTKPTIPKTLTKPPRKVRSDKGVRRKEPVEKVKQPRKVRSDKGVKRTKVQKIKLTGETVPKLTGDVKQRKVRSDKGKKRLRKLFRTDFARRITGEVGTKKPRKTRSDKGKKRTRRKWLQNQMKAVKRKWANSRALKYLPKFSESDWIAFKDSDSWFKWRWGEARDYFSSEEEFKEYIKDFFTMKKHGLDLEEVAQSTGMDYGRFYRHKMTEHFMENFKRDGGKIWDKN